MGIVIDGFYVKGQNHLDKKYFHETLEQLFKIPYEDRALGQMFYVRYDETRGFTPSMYVFMDGVTNKHLKRLNLDSVNWFDIQNRPNNLITELVLNQTVNNAISNFANNLSWNDILLKPDLVLKHDLELYATKKYVDELLTDINGGVSIDLSNYFTKTETLDKINFNIKTILGVPPLNLNTIQKIAEELINQSNKITSIEVELNRKVNTDELNEKLSDKVSIEDLNEKLEIYTPKSHLESYALKTELNSFASKEYVDNAISNIEILPPENVDLSNYYNKIQVDEIISSLTQDINVNIDLKANKIEVENELNLKANNSELDLIKEELKRRFPFKILYFNGGKICEKGDTVSVNLTWSFDGIPNTMVLTQNGINIPIDISDRSKTIDNITDNTEFILTADGLSVKQNINFYNRKYIGVITDIPNTEIDVKSLNILPLSNSRAYTWNGNLNQNMLCYCYPKSFNPLVSVKDNNNFENLTNYSCKEINVNNEIYLIYYSSPAIINNLKQIFS